MPRKLQFYRVFLAPFIFQTRLSDAVGVITANIFKVCLKMLGNIGFCFSAAASPPLSGRSSPIIIDDDITEYTVVDEVGERTDGTDGEKVSPGVEERGEGLMIQIERR